MRWLPIAMAVTLAAIAASTASAAKVPDPCAVITVKDAASALGSTPAQPKAKTVGATRACTYTIGKKKLIVVTSAVATQAAFDKAAKNSGLAIPMQGTGSDTWSVSAGKGLEVWKNGVRVAITFTGVSPFVATQQSLARTAAGRL